jgi:hypothetical protein
MPARSARSRGDAFAHTGFTDELAKQRKRIEAVLRVGSGDRLNHRKDSQMHYDVTRCSIDKSFFTGPS